MSNTRWHADARAKDGGFWVETIEPTPRQKKQIAKRKKEFALVPLPAAAAMMKAIGTPGAMVVVALFYLSWKHGGAPFPLSNLVLARYGISRGIKHRALKALEGAGLIRVEWRYKQSPLVTLTVKLSTPKIPPSAA
jgi:hypothetical protein